MTVPAGGDERERSDDLSDRSGVPIERARPGTVTPIAPVVGSGGFASGKFAWPMALVAVAAMTLGFLREHEAAPPPPAISVLHEEPTVVKDIRDLGRLETSALHVEKIVEVGERQAHLHGLVEANDTLLFVGVGEVVLGVDLAKVSPEDVTIERDGAVSVVLPPPEIFSTRFDEGKSHVHARNTDLLARRNEGLEAAARRQAIAAFEAAGRDPRAVDAAKAQAEKQLGALARAWRVPHLKVTWGREPV